MALKQHQPPMTVAQQIENLKALNLVIPDEKYAELTLNSISYFRLIKAYGLGLKAKNASFDGKTTFDDIVALYNFNEKLRQMLFIYIEHIEVTLRCRITNYFSCAYGVLGYEDSSNFVDSQHHADLMQEIQEEISRNSRAPFVKNFRTNYSGGKLPFYALVELFSFGTLSKFYKNMKPADKKAVAQLYGIGYTYLESWFEHFAYVRNICAHYGRLYNVNLSKTPALYKQYTHQGISNLRIIGTLVCMKHLFCDSEWDKFLTALKALITEYPQVKIEWMGFPSDWESILSK